jgi:hypothetical protein
MYISIKVGNVNNNIQLSPPSTPAEFLSHFNSYFFGDLAPQAKNSNLRTTLPGEKSPDHKI